MNHLYHLSFFQNHNLVVLLLFHYEIHNFFRIIPAFSDFRTDSKNEPCFSGLCSCWGNAFYSICWFFQRQGKPHHSSDTVIYHRRLLLHTVLLFQNFRFPVFRDNDGNAVSLSQGYLVATDIDSFNEYYVTDNGDTPIFDKESLDTIIGDAVNYDDVKALVESK